MSRYLDGESFAFLAGNRSFSWVALFNSVGHTIQIWRRRQRERQELIKYFATDHRAPNDLGVDRANAHDWADRPFWRA